MNHSQDAWFDRIVWGIVCMIALYASDQIKNVSESVQRLNENMAVLITGVADLRKNNDDHESRIRKLERR